MSYSLTNHPLLSADAKKLGSEALGAQRRVAERVLGLSGTQYEEAAKLHAEDALAMQVSLQVAQDPEAYLASSVTRGSRSITYRDAVPIHPLALEITQALALEAAEEGGVVIAPRQSATVPLQFGF
jgi:hypothetical protein